MQGIWQCILDWRLLLAAARGHLLMHDGMTFEEKLAQKIRKM